MAKGASHRQRIVGKQSICWRGLTFEASCAYSKISPLPSLLLKGGGGKSLFQEDTAHVISSDDDVSLPEKDINDMICNTL
jgi:hypothetical protein